MAHPWTDPNLFGALYGSIAGGLGGTVAGLIGALAGSLAPRGKGRGLVLGLMLVMVALGTVSLAVGLYALVAGQPYGIWFPMVLVGAILGGVMGGLIPVVRQRYAEAEARRLDAEGIRNS